MIAALVFLGAVCFTLVAAYQWTMYAARDWKTRVLSAALATIVWVVWFFGTTHAQRPARWWTNGYRN